MPLQALRVCNAVYGLWHLFPPMIKVVYNATIGPQTPWGKSVENTMASSKAFPDAAPILQLLTAYSFDTGNHYQAEALVVNWLQQFEPAWINQAITEALYQGRYKMVSVDHILHLWQRRGQPLRHYNREFESIILGAGFYQAPAILPPRPITPPSRAIPPLSTWLRTPTPRPTSPAIPSTTLPVSDAASNAEGDPNQPRLDTLATEDPLSHNEAHDPTMPSAHAQERPLTGTSTGTSDVGGLDAEPEDNGSIPSTEPLSEEQLNAEADLAEAWPDLWVAESEPPEPAIASTALDTPELLQTSLNALSSGMDEPKIPKFRPVPSASKPQSDGIPPFVPQPAPSELNQRLQAVVKAGQESS